MAGSSGGCTVKITDAHDDRLSAAFEVRADGCCENTEHIIVSGLNADYRADSEHVRTDVKSSARAVRRYPSLVGSDCFLNCLDKSVDRERRHLQAERGVIHSLRVEVGTETYDVSVFCLIGLKSLKDRLGILKNAGVFAHDDLVVRNESAVIPFAVLIHGHISLICHMIAESQVTPINVFLRNHYCFLLITCIVLYNSSL